MTYQPPRRGLIRAAVAGLCASAALAAQAQSLDLACPPGARAGDPATPLTLTTGSGWDISFGTSGTWAPAYTGFRHAAWYNPPTGAWLTPGPVSPPIDSSQPFLYRSPTIQVDGSRVNLSSITISIRQAADNFYNSTGISNSAGTAMTPYAGGDSFSALSAAFTPSLTWQSGGNQLLMQATNKEASHTASTPTGVYATLTITATCLEPPPPAPVPMNSPWALALLGLGVATLSARWLRRR